MNIQNPQLVDAALVIFSIATINDLPEIIALLADDVLGQAREETSHASYADYLSAFNEIAADSNNELIVGKMDGIIVAVLQITYIPNLTLKGTKRAQIEGVRVSSLVRGVGIGKKLFEDLFEKGVQLITGIKKNMKNKLMLLEDKILLRKRFIIETVNDELRNGSNIDHSRHRSPMNFLVNLVAGLVSYTYKEKKPSIKWGTGPLSLA
jgi:hypothetical protein